MEGSEIPHVNYHQLVPGVVYAIRPEHLMSLEHPARQDGCWRPTWAWGLKKMRWDDYMALPEADWPL
jgi:hypothetical protein